MNLLKQTALILGLTSLSLGGWNLYRNWGNRISILFSLFCTVVSIWALSFVSHVTLLGRLSHDIHLFCNVWFSPLVILLLSRLLLKKKNKGIDVLKWISIGGALILGSMIGLSLPRSEIISDLINFWPALIMFELIYIMILDFTQAGSINTDYISPSKKVIFYIGLTLSLSLCSFDRIPMLGYTIPAIGNLLFTVFLIFSSQLILPQKALGIEVLVSRFFATVILALIITGFFALLFNYISGTFPLFLLNSFLISFSVLTLWNPLVTFFRYLGRKLRRKDTIRKNLRFEKILLSISVATDLDDLKLILLPYFKDYFEAESVTLTLDQSAIKLPPRVRAYFDEWSDRSLSPLLHRELILREREQVLTLERKQELDLLIQFLDNLQVDLIFPIFYLKQVIALLNLKISSNEEEGSLDLSQYTQVGAALTELGPTLKRLVQMESEKEKDRLLLMGEMAAGLAHEVRNPLGAIRGAVDLLGVDQSTNAPWIKIIQEEVNRLNRLVSQFLDFAQDPKEVPELLNLNDAVKVVVERIQLQAKVKIDLQLSPNQNLQLKIVPDHLQQILFNLIENASKALEGVSAPKLQVIVAEGGFEVIDNGKGMDAETLKNVFTPFFTTFKDGTGLGLAIAKRLVHFNQGKISMDSELGRGTQVKVIFNPDSLALGAKS